MKTANVVSVRDRGPLDATRDGVASSRVARMSDFLRRYPAIDDREREQLLAFLTKGAQEEIVQATHLQGLENELRAFRKDHRREFNADLMGWLPIILVIVVPILGVLWRLLG